MPSDNLIPDVEIKITADIEPLERKLAEAEAELEAFKAKQEEAGLGRGSGTGGLPQDAQQRVHAMQQDVARQAEQLAADRRAWETSRLSAAPMAAERFASRVGGARAPVSSADQAVQATASSALRNLGYKSGDAQSAVAATYRRGMTTEAATTAALRYQGLAPAEQAGIRAATDAARAAESRPAMARTPLAIGRILDPMAVQAEAASLRSAAIGQERLAAAQARQDILTRGFERIDALQGKGRDLAARLDAMGVQIDRNFGAVAANTEQMGTASGEAARSTSKYARAAAAAAADAERTGAVMRLGALQADRATRDAARSMRSVGLGAEDIARLQGRDLAAVERDLAGGGGGAGGLGRAAAAAAGGGGRGGGGLGRILPLIGIGVGAIGALGPAAGGVALGMGGAAATLGLAGVGAFLGLKPTISALSVADQIHALQWQQQYLRAHHQGQQAQMVGQQVGLLQAQAAESGMNLNTVAPAANAMWRMEGAFRALTRSVQPAFVADLSSLFHTLANTLPRMAPLVKGAATGLGDAFHILDAVLANRGFTKFMTWAGTQAPQAMGDAMRVLLNFGIGFGNILQASTPLIDGFMVGMRNLSGGFNQGTQALSTNKGWHGFLRAAQTEIPQVGNFLGSLAGDISKLYGAIAPAGPWIITAFRDLAQGLGPDLTTLKNDLAPIWPKLGPILTTIATDLPKVLNGLLKAAGPILGSLARILGLVEHLKIGGQNIGSDLLSGGAALWFGRKRLGSLGRILGGTAAGGGGAGGGGAAGAAGAAADAGFLGLLRGAGGRLSIAAQDASWVTAVEPLLKMVGGASLFQSATGMHGRDTAAWNAERFLRTLDPVAFHGLTQRFSRVLGDKGNVPTWAITWTKGLLPAVVGQAESAMVRTLQGAHAVVGRHGQLPVQFRALAVRLQEMEALQRGGLSPMAAMAMNPRQLGESFYILRHGVTPPSGAQQAHARQLAFAQGVMRQSGTPHGAAVIINSNPTLQIHVAGETKGELVQLIETRIRQLWPDLSKRQDAVLARHLEAALGRGR